jgi:hypothetical protein
MYLLPVHTPFSTSTGIFYWQLTQYFTSGHYYWLGYVPAFQFDKLSLHSELEAYSAQFNFHFSIGFPKLATGIIWAALNGTDGANIGFTVPTKRHAVAPKKTVGLNPPQWFGWKPSTHYEDRYATPQPWRLGRTFVITGQRYRIPLSWNRQ